MLIVYRVIQSFTIVYRVILMCARILCTCVFIGLPSTYTYDSSSGFYYDTMTGLYYDPKTQVIFIIILINIIIPLSLFLCIVSLQ